VRFVGDEEGAGCFDLAAFLGGGGGGEMSCSCSSSRGRFWRALFVPLRFGGSSSADGESASLYLGACAVV